MGTSIQQKLLYTHDVPVARGEMISKANMVPDLAMPVKYTAQPGM